MRPRRLPAVRPVRRVAVAVALLAGVLAGCQAEAPEPRPTAAATGDAALAGIRSARAELGAPAVALAESVLALRDSLDAARHEVDRGDPMAEALDVVADRVGDVRAAADASETATAALGAETAPEVAEAVEVVVEAVAEARAAADAAEEERAALLELVPIDRRLEEAVAAWDEPGSQTQRRTALAGLADELDALAQQAAEIAAGPEGCPQLVEHRVTWAQLLAERSRRLAETATSAGGRDHDELRAAFTRDPYGEDRQVADARTRSCWQERSTVVEAAAAAPPRVEALEAALNP